MNDTQKTIFIGFLAFVFSFAIAFLFYNTGLTVDELFSFELTSNITRLVSQSFLVFFIAFPLMGALIATASYYIDRETAFVSICGAGILGLGIASVVFSTLFGFLWLGLFFILGLALAVWQVYMKRTEFKSWVLPRLSSLGMQKAAGALAIGLVVFSAATIIPQKQQYAAAFDEKLADSIFSNNSLQNVTSGISTSLAQNYVQAQRAILEQVTSLQQYSALQSETTDTESQNFVTAMSTLKQTVDSPQYQQSVEQQISRRSQTVNVNPREIFEQTSKTVPLFGLMREWLWLIYGFGLASILMLISSIVLQPLSMAWSYILFSVFKVLFKESEKHMEEMRV